MAHFHRFKIGLTCGAVAALFAISSVQAVETTSYITSNSAEGCFQLATEAGVAPIFLDANDFPGVHRVARHLQADLERVTKHRPKLKLGETPAGREVVIIGAMGKSKLIDALIENEKLSVSTIAGKPEAFLTSVVEQPLPGVERALVIVGSDKRGAIYGMYDLSAQIGVSPWYWWADVPVPSRPELSVLPGQYTLGSPKVKYRGIFINDEAPALSGWMHEKFGGHNHKFYDHVFELILRLRGNYLWPAMWGRSIYDDDPESPKLADEYGVVIGMSHHEPMMRSHVEWERYGKGPWNYEKNQDVLQTFWADGIRRMGTNESVVTIGMRGDGDEPMSESANIALLERIVADQRKIIGEVTGKRPEDLPQIWALYKEVQEYYDRGMRVPDDVTLLLCDDNWGNIRKLPALDAKPRSGGYGIYYHFDYVGGPRNYKWLNTNSIPRIWEQMHLAYEYGARQLWIVNVGDIKPMELPTEFFLDYAWNPDAWPAGRLTEYTRQWAAEQFGEEHSSEIGQLLDDYTRFNARRKPELLSPETYSLSNYGEAERVVAEYNELLRSAKRIGDELAAEYQDAYFQLVLHPIEACANLNELYFTVAKNRQYAEQGRAATNDLAKHAKRLFERDAEISQHYNQAISGGKWAHMMDQTHIGYSSWQEPQKNLMPEVETIELPAAGSLAVAVESSDEYWPHAPHRLVLPKFNSVDDDRHYFEIFNRGMSNIAFSIEVETPWLRVVRDPASNESDGMLQQQQRYWVEIDWAKLSAGEHRAAIKIAGLEGATANIEVIADNLAPDLKEHFRGHVDTNGYVSIEAEHFGKKVETDAIAWQVVPGFGRTHSGVMPIPVTAAAQQLASNTPHLEYPVYLSSGGTIKVHALVAPTLNFHNSQGLRYAISFDDQPPQVMNMHSAETPRLWEKWVADNVNITISEHELNLPGEHILKFWMVDPGVVLQKLVVDTGGLRASYLGPPESKRSSSRVP